MNASPKCNHPRFRFVKFLRSSISRGRKGKAVRKSAHGSITGNGANRGARLFYVSLFDRSSHAEATSCAGGRNYSLFSFSVVSDQLAFRQHVVAHCLE
jgi:hypothetical protein